MDPAGTIDVLDTHRFDVDALERYVSGRIAGFTAPIEVRQFRGGQSNPTYYLKTSGGASGADPLAAPKRRSREGGQRIAHDSTPIACGNCQPFEVAAGLPPILKVHGQAFGLPSMSTMAGNKRFVYVVKNTDGIPNFYVGLSSDVKSRLADHNAGHCPHTASRRPARHLAARGFRVMLQMARNVLTCRCDQTSFAAA